MRILVLGSGAFALPSLDWLRASGHELVAVVTQAAKESGRGRRVTATPVGQAAASAGFPVIQTPDVNAPEIIAELRDHAPDLAVVIAFGQKIQAQLRAVAPLGFINLHASLLPRYRGAAPINWAIVRGETRTGCTVFEIVDRMDAGPILSSVETDILPVETAGELHDRLAVLGVEALRAAIELYTGGHRPPGQAQDDTLVTKAPKLEKPDGFIHFAAPAASVVGRIHGMTPWPGAAAVYRSVADRWENVIFVRARMVADRPVSGPPGAIDAQGTIACVDRPVELLELKPSSGRVMTWRDYVNGRHVREGDIFVAPSERRTP